MMHSETIASNFEAIFISTIQNFAGYAFYFYIRIKCHFTIFLRFLRSSSGVQNQKYQGVLFAARE
ncbi:hypothetical protein ALP45_01508 [Pseudomonas coronafaciens pv. atropurpurea]|nr:Unknown protein sequence [Pseudomonas coronafaciens pv. atropurpurea]RMT62414.1 hypothetical protein ALP45_01508 [Pseudomonas coronafaciens pv. atropurpurea]